MPYMTVVVDDEADQVLKGPTFIGDENLDPEIMKDLEGAHSEDYNAHRSPFPPRKVLELLEMRGYKVLTVTNLKETLIWTLHKNRPVGKKAGGAAVTKKQPGKSGKAANTRANSKSSGSAEQSGVDEEGEGSGSEDNEPAPVKAPAKKAAAAATGPKKAVAKKGKNPTISDNDE